MNVLYTYILKYTGEVQNEFLVEHLLGFDSLRDDALHIYIYIPFTAFSDLMIYIRLSTTRYANDLASMVGLSLDLIFGITLA